MRFPRRPAPKPHSGGAGRNYSFRLTVKDPFGAQGIARWCKYVEPRTPQVITFTATPATINGTVLDAELAGDHADSVSLPV